MPLDRDVTIEVIKLNLYVVTSQMYFQHITFNLPVQ
jgi:hypothetical protein